MPFEKDCFELKHFLLTTFTPFNFTSNMTVTVEDLYPQKLENFRKCPVFVAVAIIDPLTYIRNTSDGKIQYRGIDIGIMNQISRVLNFSIVYKRSNGGSGHGIIFPNGTVTENLHSVCI